MRLLLWLVIAALCSYAAAARPGPGHGGGKPPSGVQTIASISPSSCSFVGGTTNGPICSLSVTMSPASPSFSGTLALCTGTNTPVSGCSGANAGGFHLSGSTIQQSTGGSGTANGSYTDVTAYASQGGLSTIFQPLSLTGSAGVASSEEFVGPFASWLNVQTGCGGAGAVGDGSTDDTAAIQRCLTALSPSTAVVYFPTPSASYKITSTLTVFSKQSVALVGADPATTTIKWFGISNGTMLNFENNVSSRVIRLTFDGQSVAGIGAEENYSGSGNYFDQGNVWSDDVFKNTTHIAFYCGRIAGCANIPLIRTKFINNVNGVFAGNQNALDINAWYSLFQNNTRAMTNVTTDSINGGGSFNTYNSTFLSNTADIYTANPLYTGVRTNYSSGSGRFYTSADSCGTNNAVLQNNLVLDSVTSDTLHFSDIGPNILLDNAVRNASGNTVAPVALSGQCSLGDAFSLGNTFTVGTPSSSCAGSSPIQMTSGGGRCHSTLDQVVSAGTFNSTFDTTIPTLPGTPPNLGRTIVEAGPSGSGTTCSAGSPCTIQTAVCKAATGSTGFSSGACTGSVTPSRAVVHLPCGNYTITSTIAVPASDIQIIADSNCASLNGTSLAGAPIMKLAGPSKVVLGYFFMDVSGPHTADGIEIDAADQSGARVFAEDIELGNYSSAGLFSDNLNNTLIEIHELLLGENTTTPASGIKVVGGGSNLGGQTNIFDMDGAGNFITFNVSGDGRLLVEDCFCGDEAEVPLFLGVSGHKLATITGSGAFTFSGGMGLNYNLATDPVISVTNFTGDLAITSSRISGDLSITGAGTGANNLIVGMLDGWKAERNGTVSSGSTTLTFDAVPTGVAAGQWVSDFSNPTAIPASLSTPSTVSSKTSTTVVMSQAAVGSGVDGLAFYVATPYLDSSGATKGYLNPLTAYNKNTDQNAQQLPESGSSSSGFLTTALAQQRAAAPTVPGALSVGVTDVRIYGLFIQNCINALHVMP